jgi:hypothetical protein
MGRFLLGVTLLALPAFVFSLMLAGCGGGKDTGPTGGSSSEATQEKEKSSGPAKVLEPKGGVLKGKITLTSKPNVEQLSEQLKVEINKNKAKDFCLSGSPEEIAQQEYRIGKNGNLGNVFVWILPPSSNDSFKVDPKELAEAKKNPVKIGQPHCAFLPHCAVAWVDYRDPKNPGKKVPTGQSIEVVNNAKEESHNTNVSASRNPSPNQTLAPGRTLKIEGLRSVAEPMRLKCDIHTWMRGYVWLLDTPYSAISYSDTLEGKNKVKEDDDKFGTYEIKNLPVGKMRVLAWHEKCEWLTKNGVRGEEIEIAEGKETEKNFEATPK